jgi:hypothetical protein
MYNMVVDTMAEYVVSKFKVYVCVYIIKFTMANMCILENYL